MSKYYVLNWFTPLRAERHTLEVGFPANSLRWYSGRLFSEQDKDEDFNPPTGVIEVRTEKPSGRLPHVYPEYAANPIPLMTRRLINALREAGVGNLQTYETRLVDPPGTPAMPADLYLAVNVVGRVAAADLQLSMLNPEVSDTMISMDFHSLTVDCAKARGALMFRLAENISAVLVHKSVRDFVLDRGIDSLTWLKPEDWAG